MKPLNLAKPENTYAVVVGIEEYPKWKDFKLEGAVEEACLITEWLLRCQVPQDHIWLFLSPLCPKQLETREVGKLGLSLADVNLDDANSSTINDALREQLAGCPDAELLFLFWFGHGVIEIDHYPRLFYADASSRNAQCLDLNSLTLSLRSRAFESVHQQIVIVDACQKYAEKILKPPAMPVEHRFPPGAPKFRPQFQLFSTQPGQPAAALSPGDEESFGYQLRRHLAEAVKTQPGVWPPDMEAVAERIQKTFIDLQAGGKSLQVPQFKCVNWRGGGTDDLRDTPALGRRTGATKGRSLTDDRRCELTGRLLALRALNAERRDAVVQFLPQANHVLQFDSANFFEQLTNASLAWPGGLEALTESLHVFDPSDPALGTLYTTLDRFFPQVVEWGEVGELKRLLAGLSPAVENKLLIPLLEASSQSSPWDCCQGRQRIFGLIDWLALRSTSNGGTGVPLLDFVEQNMRGFPDDLRSLLDMWLAKVSDRFPGRKKAKKSSPARSPVSPSLLIRVVSKVKDSVQGQIYELQGWLANAPGRPKSWTPSVTPAKNATTFARMPEVISAMLVLALRHLDHKTGALTVEIFMPRKLLVSQEACDLLWLKLKLVGDLESPLSVDYTVVFRSEERAFEPMMERTWDVWRDRWKKRPISPPIADDSHIICIDYFNINNKYLLLNKLREGGPVCLAPCLSSGEGTEVETLSRLDLLLASGTPIAVWHHRPVEDVPAVMSELKTLVRGAPGGRPPLPSLDKLPSRVWELRKKAWYRGQEAEQAGTLARDENPLVLLWDNPFLLPPGVEEPGQFEQPL